MPLLVSHFSMKRWRLRVRIPWKAHAVKGRNNLVIFQLRNINVLLGPSDGLGVGRPNLRSSSVVGPIMEHWTLYIPDTHPTTKAH